MDSFGKSGATALHWAASDNSYFALQYLLALGANIDAVDNKGVSALHLAVKESIEDKNSRCIRLLLKRGADSTIRDNFGKTPKDIVETFKQDDFKEELLTLLDRDSSAACCHGSILNYYAPTTASRIPLVTFTILMLGSCLMLHTLLYPLVANERIKLVIDIAYLVAAVFAIFSCNMNPGKVKNTQDFMVLL